MNRAKRQMNNRDQKKMAKTIRAAQGQYPVRETRETTEKLTPKDLLKKYPSKQAKKHEAIMQSTQQTMAIKHKKKMHEKIPSKRTTPGLVPDDSTPAHVHPEGGRWIKNLIKQNVISRFLQARRAGGTGRKK